MPDGSDLGLDGRLVDADDVGQPSVTPQRGASH